MGATKEVQVETILHPTPFAKCGLKKRLYTFLCRDMDFPACPTHFHSV